ncbi:MAG: hypothetical protein DMG23_10570 [Acidobacteria bacterium]|nr:MAG: hypothetical protein DMG23_10570 [Acidobacteriota bacterium]
MSTTVVAYPLVSALVESEKILGPDRQWKSVNDTQARFLKEFFAESRREKLPEIESCVSWDAAEVSAFMAQRGFPLEIPPFPPQTFGAAGVLDLLVEWFEKGEVDTIKTGLIRRREFPAVQIWADHVVFFRAPGHKNPLACVKTKSGDEVYMTMLADPPAGFDLVANAQELSRNKRHTDEFSGLIFPMVDLDHLVDVDWLAGMETTEIHGQPSWIAKAYQRTRLRMNEFGARAESAAFEVLEGAAGSITVKPPHVIDRPFLIWFERQGLAKPLFVGHITEDDWRNPGTLA